MSENSKDMCVDKKTVEDIIDHRTGQLASDLRSDNKVIMKDLEYIKEQTTKTNSRVNTNEEGLQNLREEHLQKELTCPFKEDITYLKQKESEAKKVSELLSEQEEKRINESRLFYKRVQAWTGVITGIFIILIYGSEIVDFIIKAIN